jgi:hypothetical protein
MDAAALTIVTLNVILGLGFAWVLSGRLVRLREWPRGRVAAAFLLAVSSGPWLEVARRVVPNLARIRL